MTRFTAAIAALPVLLALAACQTTNSGSWNGGASTKFADAEETCEGQTANIEEEGDRPEFFVSCMATLGWTPKPGTTFATPETAPDPT